MRRAIWNTHERIESMAIPTTRIILAFISSVACLMTAMAGQPENTDLISIVPRPVKILPATGSFPLDENSVIVFERKDAELDSIANQFAVQLRTVTGYPISFSGSERQDGAIVLSVDAKKNNLQKEGYELVVTPKQVRITGFDEAGVFYGVQTLLQLLPPEVGCNKPVHGMSWSIPCVHIEDYPRFVWRGMHLDVGRHFFSVNFVKKYLDLMAMYKLNVFHWHLTEDQGWRIEIKRYPLLTKVGAWRKETMGDGVPEGGFYTQDQMRDVVAYAKERHIQVVPEIEMPGHSRGALAAYPQYSCVGAPLDVGTMWGVEKEVYCAGNDSAYEFIENILTEVFELFPSKYIHIGGDECPKDRWRQCPRCQARIKSEGLHNEEELQSYFVKRIEKFINSRGKRIIGWDEILEGGLAPNATVMSWRGTKGGIDAARSGHDVVMSPTSNCYFDYDQALTGESKGAGDFLPMDAVYKYEPVPQELNADEARHVLGSQGNMWTEYVADPNRAEYMLVPRMCALSEMVWTQKNLRNYDDFLKRMGPQYDRLTIADVHYRVPTPFVLGGSVASFQDSVLMFSGVPSDAKTYYTVDGEEPNRDALLYSAPIILTKSIVIKAKTFLANGRSSNTVTIDFSRLDSSVNGLIYSFRLPKDSSEMNPNQWILDKSGIIYSVELPYQPPIPGAFSVTFSGFLTVEKEGLYTFYLRADSGSVLSVDHVELINGGPADARWWRSGTIYLKAGKYPLAILDLELDQWRGVAVELEGPGFERQSIPARLFSRK